MEYKINHLYSYILYYFVQPTLRKFFFRACLLRVRAFFLNLIALEMIPGNRKYYQLTWNSK